MASELVPITFNKIMQSRSYTVIILGTAEKRFAIYT
ncbi:MAG: bifunctional nuclease family protein, partial [Verrucomicrobia bacterium]|nr:bifunctional nuclease family protein [Verrucomicrobiota bacterium]